ncbi:IpaD/SipD/SspD family type III secretion system needle tip protein [Escherichia marmotae]|nr:IpaD/SipD/SspD family type III secretion system needle tip protein [Escherichia marmotae]MED9358607.1 IpaD/SipD/SspD family type III secretion system needle tip protein [Escherichia marmotae]
MNDITTTTSSVLKSIDTVKKTTTPQVTSEKAIDNSQVYTEETGTFNTELFAPTSDVLEALSTLLSGSETDLLTLQYVASVVDMYMKILAVARREYQTSESGEFPFPKDFLDILYQSLPSEQQIQVTDAMDKQNYETVWTIASDFLETYYKLYGAQASSITAEKCYEATLESESIKILLSDSILSALTVLCLTYMEKTYTKVALGIADVYSQLVEELNTEFFNKFSTWISSDKDGIKVKAKEMLNALDDFQYFPYTSKEKNELQDKMKLLTESVSEETGKAWLEQLGLSDDCLIKMGNECWLIADLYCMKDLRENLMTITNGAEDYVFKTTAEYDAFQKQITNNNNQLSTTVSTISTNTSHTVDQANSLYKILHTLPETLYNTDKSFLNS